MSLNTSSSSAPTTLRASRGWASSPWSQVAVLARWAVPEPVGQPNANDRKIRHDQNPGVPGKVVIHHDRGGSCGEGRKSGHDAVECGVAERGGPDAAGVEPKRPKEEAFADHRRHEEGQDDQLVRFWWVYPGGKKDRWHVPGGLGEPDQHKSPRSAHGQDPG